MSVRSVAVKIERVDSGKYVAHFRVGYDAASPVKVSKNFDTPSAALLAAAALLDASENGGALA